MEKSRNVVIALVVVVVILIILFFAYEKCALNKMLPVKWRKSDCPAANGNGNGNGNDAFRGAYGRSPAMQACLLGHDPKNPFNACMWV